MLDIFLIQFSKLLKKIVNKLISLFINIYYFYDRSKMLYCGKNTVFKFGLRIDNPECLYIGDDVYINTYAWLSMGKYVYQKDSPTINNNPLLKIDNGAYIGRFVSISCGHSIYVGKNVLIADRCYIGDIQHGFENISLPIKDQYIVSKGDISIGDDTWIGNNVSILPNVKIGQHCVIGANSVVTKDIPDYHIAVGNPAKIIKKINF